jgi:hypothetical protein
VRAPFTEPEIAALDAACPFELMRFTLIYDGELAASGNSPKPKEKWRIRRALQPQLAELWQTHTMLSRLAYVSIPTSGGYFSIERHHKEPLDPRPNNPGDRLLCGPIEVAGNKFIPLVRDSMALVCHLQILFLRKEAPGKLVKQGGDLDNRIKTLFDALRMPKADEMQAAEGPIEDPFYCLAEDDSLITGYEVSTGYLLTRPGGNVHDVHLAIDVNIKVTHVRSYNLPLLGD